MGWDDIAGPIAAIAGPVAGAAMTGAINRANVGEQRQWLNNQAGLARLHQVDMRRTAYQATMKDMRAAGLNPILAYGKGPTAAGSSPSASGQAAAAGDYASAMSNGVSNALQGIRVKNETKRMKQELMVMEADAGLKDQLRTESEAKTTLSHINAEQSAAATNATLLSNIATAAKQSQALTRGEVDRSPTGRAMIKVNQHIRNLIGGTPIKPRLPGVR